jgi:hypothetical protein
LTTETKSRPGSELLLRPLGTRWQYTISYRSIKGVLVLTAVPDLAYVYEHGECNKAAEVLSGGSPEEFPERYAHGSAIELVPLGVPQILLSGKYDTHWAPMIAGYSVSKYEFIQTL